MILNMIGSNGPLMKSTIIVSTTHESSVGAYSDAGCTALVKNATERSEGEFWITGLNNATYYIKATLGQKTSIYQYTINEFGVYRIEILYTTIPEFTYTDGTYGVEGEYEIVQDDDTIIDDPSSWWGNWKIRFLTSGVLNISQRNGMINGIDVFLVGGGGGGGGASSGAGSGGGGGYTETHRTVAVSTNINYPIIIGDGGELRTDGGSSSGFDYTANGGSHGKSGGAAGGAGGSGGGAGGSIGGAGGSDGSNGSNGGSSGTIAGGSGQGTTTREFAEVGAKLYAGGGGGAVGGAGGAGGGATAGSKAAVQQNTGGGGAGGASDITTAQAGASGIVIIRNAR